MREQLKIFGCVDTNGVHECWNTEYAVFWMMEYTRVRDQTEDGVLHHCTSQSYRIRYSPPWRKPTSQNYRWNSQNICGHCRRTSRIHVRTDKWRTEETTTGCSPYLHLLTLHNSRWRTHHNEETGGLPNREEFRSGKNPTTKLCWVVLQDGVNYQLVFIDEAGFNLHTKRTRGRARRGERAVRVVSGDRGPNLTVCFAVSPQLCLVHHTIDNGGMTIGKFENFLREVSTRLGETQTFFIFDNAPCHSRAITTSPQHHIQRLPPYSPFLNITEMAISAWKAKVKRCLAEVRDQILNGPIPAGVSQRQHRMAILAQLGEQSVDAITPEKSTAWFQHTQGYLPRCLDMTDIMQWKVVHICVFYDCFLFWNNASLILGFLAFFILWKKHIRHFC